MENLLSKFNGLRWWKKLLIVIITILLIVFWAFVLSNTSQWWHWDEWIEHINNNH